MARHQLAFVQGLGRTGRRLAMRLCSGGAEALLPGSPLLLHFLLLLLAVLVVLIGLFLEHCELLKVLLNLL